MTTDIEFKADADGTAIALVPAGSITTRVCEIEKADYEFLLKSGVSAHWGVSNGKYVSAIKDGRRDYIARMICMAGKGQTISYRDGNTFNLRRSNLAVTEKRAAPVQFQSREAA